MTSQALGLFRCLWPQEKKGHPVFVQKSPSVFEHSRFPQNQQTLWNKSSPFSSQFNRCVAHVTVPALLLTQAGLMAAASAEDSVPPEIATLARVNAVWGFYCSYGLIPRLNKTLIQKYGICVYPNPKILLPKREESPSIKSQAEKAAQQLEREIGELKEKISKVDGFILEDPTLRQLCAPHAKKYNERIAQLQKPDAEGLDPHDPIDKMTLLGIEKNTLSFTLQERMYFIVAYPEINAAFKERFEEKQKEFSNS